MGPVLHTRLPTSESGAIYNMDCELKLFYPNTCKLFKMGFVENPEPQVCGRTKEQNLNSTTGFSYVFTFKLIIIKAYLLEFRESARNLHILAYVF
jgi:hypothetical protein